MEQHYNPGSEPQKSKQETYWLGTVVSPIIPRNISLFCYTMNPFTFHNFSKLNAGKKCSKIHPYIICNKIYNTPLYNMSTSVMKYKIQHIQLLNTDIHIAFLLIKVKKKEQYTFYNPTKLPLLIIHKIYQMNLKHKATKLFSWGWGLNLWRWKKKKKK